MVLSWIAIEFFFASFAVEARITANAGAFRLSDVGGILVEKQFVIRCRGFKDAADITQTLVKGGTSTVTACSWSGGGLVRVRRNQYTIYRK